MQRMAMLAPMLVRVRFFQLKRAATTRASAKAQKFTPAVTTERPETSARPLGAMEYEPVVVWSTCKPPVSLMSARSEREPEPSSFARPMVLGNHGTVGKPVPVEKLPDRMPFEKPPLGGADCGSAKPSPELVAGSRKKASFVSTR